MDSRGATDRPRLDARTTAWLLALRAEVRALELERARLAGELAASERIERASQRYADRMEEKLDGSRKREASLARALGYVEAQRDQLAARLGPGRGASSPELGEHELAREIVPTARRAPRSSAGAKR